MSTGYFPIKQALTHNNPTGYINYSTPGKDPQTSSNSRNLGSHKKHSLGLLNVETFGKCERFSKGYFLLWCVVGLKIELIVVMPDTADCLYPDLIAPAYGA